jgi:carotenoid 1,2-hydratase
MPVLPLFQTPAHPDAWHHVTAPGGYEWWHFDGEDATGRYQFVATFFEGFPFDPAYLRRYARYRRNPTRHRPPLPGEYPYAYFGVYEEGRVLARFLSQVQPGEFSASVERPDVRMGSNGFTTDADGTLRLRLDGPTRRPAWRGGARRPDGRRLTGEFEFLPLLAGSPRERDRFPRSPSGAGHRWVIANPLCNVKGTVRLKPEGFGAESKNGSPGRTIEFAGRGYHDHQFGTGPIALNLRQWVSGRVLTDRSILSFHIVRPRDPALSDEAELVEADGVGVRDVTTTCLVDWERRGLAGLTYPARIIFGDRLRLSNPRVLGTDGCHGRVSYDAQLDGGTTAAFCDVFQPRRLAWSGSGKPVRASVALDRAEP